MDASILPITQGLTNQELRGYTSTPTIGTGLDFRSFPNRMYSREEVMIFHGRVIDLRLKAKKRRRRYLCQLIFV
jgi:hypothetical protein